MMFGKDLMLFPSNGNIRLELSKNVKGIYDFYVIMLCRGLIKEEADIPNHILITVLIISIKSLT